MTARIIAVDWSGAKMRAARKIWLAEARDGELLRLESGRDRDQLVEELVELKGAGDPLAIGLDFGFSFPAWYMRERGFAAAHDAWRWLAEDGCADALLADCAAPFWGAASKLRPAAIEGFRTTERAVERTEGVRPKSVFQIGGAGAVGTGSIRGMAALHALSDAGIAVWPFDAPGVVTAFEIYPRLFTGPVYKSSEDARSQYLAPLRSSMPRSAYANARACEDAFDAAISAIEMSKHAADLEALPHIDDPVLRLEGIIWWPRWHKAHVDLLS
jgi:hypothetical protein